LGQDQPRRRLCDGRGIIEDPALDSY
jgi:hypothetical protein